jgi:hypothetical protein
MKKNKDKNKTYYKQTGLVSIKGADVTPDMLDIINSKYAQETLAAGDIYVQKELLAHNGIDRDRERFPEDLLDDYARTLPGKSFLEVHDRSRLPIGLYFDAKTEEISKEQFKEITGEEIRLPDEIDKAKVIFAWIYTLRKEWNQKLIDNLSGGIYRHRSIGFTATDFKAVKGEFDQVLYFEYVAPGEAREGSIVYLGAQQGATSQKDIDRVAYKVAQSYLHDGEKAQNLNSWLTSHKDETGSDEQQVKDIENNVNNEKGGKDSMDLKAFLEKLSKEFKTLFTEDGIADEIKALIGAAGTKADTQIKVKETKITELETKISELDPLAADGKAFRQELVKDNIRMKAALKDIGESEEDQKGVKAVVENHPIDYLKNENKSLQKRMEVAFPNKSQTEGDDSRDKSKDGEKENVLIPNTDSKK